MIDEPQKLFVVFVAVKQTSTFVSTIDDVEDAVGFDDSEPTGHVAGVATYGPTPVRLEVLAGPEWGQTPLQPAAAGSFHTIEPSNQM
jgi:hypothetical protein